MASLFSNAKSTEKTTKAKKQKPQVQLPNEFAAKIKRFNTLKSELETLKTELSGLDGELKTVGRQIFLDLYEKNQTKPENFKMVSGLEQLLFILMDKYIKVDDAKIVALRQFFGATETEGKSIDKQKLSQFNSILDTKVIYSFDPVVLERNEKAVSDAIMNSKKISDEDKKNLLVVQNEVSIKKGTINNLANYKDFRTLFTLIEPIAQLKSNDDDEK